MLLISLLATQDNQSAAYDSAFDYLDQQQQQQNSNEIQQFAGLGEQQFFPGQNATATAAAAAQQQQLTFSFVLISLLLSTIVVCTLIGNLFVIFAILIDKNLQTTANQLVLSLAVADLMVACLVMPLGAYNDIHQGWYLGKGACEFWTSADVLCCTASILNLLAIAVDRYWAVTNVDYIYKRTRKRVSLMILCAWTVGAIVSLAPIFGWKDPDFAHRVLAEHKCLVSQDLAYQVFATISTFYAPLVLLLALYWRIFQVARKRIRCKPGERQVQTTTTTTISRSDHQLPGRQSSQTAAGHEAARLNLNLNLNLRQQCKMFVNFKNKLALGTQPRQQRQIQSNFVCAETTNEKRESPGANHSSEPSEPSKRGTQATGGRQQHEQLERRINFARGRAGPAPTAAGQARDAQANAATSSCLQIDTKRGGENHSFGSTNLEECNQVRNAPATAAATAAHLTAAQPANNKSENNELPRNPIGVASEREEKNVNVSDNPGEQFVLSNCRGGGEQGDKNCRLSAGGPTSGDSTEKINKRRAVAAANKAHDDEKDQPAAGNTFSKSIESVGGDTLVSSNSTAGAELGSSRKTGANLSSARIEQDKCQNFARGTKRVAQSEQGQVCCSLEQQQQQKDRDADLVGREATSIPETNSCCCEKHLALDCCSQVANSRDNNNNKPTENSANANTLKDEKLAPNEATETGRLKQFSDCCCCCCCQRRRSFSLSVPLKLADCPACSIKNLTATHVKSRTDLGDPLKQCECHGSANDRAAPPTTSEQLAARFGSTDNFKEHCSSLSSNSSLSLTSSSLANNNKRLQLEAEEEDDEEDEEESSLSTSFGQLNVKNLLRQNGNKEIGSQLGQRPLGNGGDLPPPRSVKLELVQSDSLAREDCAPEPTATTTTATSCNNNRALDLKRKFKALGQIVSFVQTSRQFNSSSSAQTSQSGDDADGHEHSEQEEEDEHETRAHVEVAEATRGGGKNSSASTAHLPPSDWMDRIEEGRPRPPQANNSKTTGEAESKAGKAATISTTLGQLKSLTVANASIRHTQRQRAANLDIKREKKAAKTLAIITGVFVCCWLPFFVNAIVMPICGQLCTPSDLIMSILLWLGYLNSLLNPIIYTIFSPDFRRAFNRLLCLQTKTTANGKQNGKSRRANSARTRPGGGGLKANGQNRGRLFDLSSTVERQKNLLVR